MRTISGARALASANRGVSACHASRGSMRPAAGDCFGLPEATARALAEMLPVLICGEASAETMFSCAAEAFTRRGEAALATALAGIVQDEQRHAAWLAELRAGLPSPRGTGAARAVTRFLRELHSDALALHLGRVAGLDAAVSLVLARACRRSAPLAAAPVPLQVFNRIRLDEGRHVRISRRCATALGLSPELVLREQRTVYARFADLLLPWGDSLERLGIERAWLRRRFIPDRRGCRADGVP